MRLRSPLTTAVRRRASKGPGSPSRSSTAHTPTVTSQTTAATAADAAIPSSKGFPVSLGMMTKIVPNMSV